MRFINLHFRRICKIAKWLWASFCLFVRPTVCLSVCPHVTIRLPPDGFSLNLKFDDFSKSVENIQFRQKIWRVMGTVYEDLCTFIIIPSVFSGWGSWRPPDTEGRCEKTYGGYAVYGKWDNVQRSDDCSVNNKKKFFLGCYESLRWSGNLSAMETTI